jgi:hypothetical protein
MFNGDNSNIHGSLLACGRILNGLSQNPKFWGSIDKESIEAISGVISSINLGRLDGFGSDLIRDAACQFIDSCADSGFLAHCDKEIVLKSWLDMLHSTLSRQEEPLVNTAVNSLNTLFNRSEFEITDQILDSFIDNINPESEKYTRRGFVLALNEFPISILTLNQEKIIKQLIIACKINPNDNLNDAEYRRNSVLALFKICQKITPEDNLSLLVCDSFVGGMSDYYVDSRGDVGSWIREASMRGMETMLITSPKIDTNLRIRMIGLILFSCAEKIDRIRETAGKVITRLLKNHSIEIPSRTLLEEALLTTDIYFNWLSARKVFPVITKLLSIPCYRDKVMCGIICSIGGLTESLVRFAGESFIDFCTKLPTKATGNEMILDDVLESIHSIFIEYQGVERVSIPVVDCLDLYISSGFLTAETNVVHVKGVFNLLKREIFKSKNTKKIVSAIKVLAGFACVDEIVENIYRLAVEKLCLYLAHPFPVVRTSASEALYMVISSGVVTLELEKMEIVEDLVLNKKWDVDLGECKSNRARIQAFLL